MISDQVTTGQIFERLGAIIRENGVPLIGCVAILSAIDVALEQYAPTISALPSGIASIVAQYYLTITALERQGLRQPDGGRFGSFFLLGILSGLGILLGTLLLILPGVYLAIRWSAASAVLLADKKSANDALSESWAMTQKSFWPILGAYLVIIVPAFIVGIGLSAALGGVWPIASSLVVSILTLSAFAISWLAGVAIYSLLKPGTDPLVEIFA